MKEALFGIDNLDVYLVIGILMFFGLLETAAGFLKSSKRSLGDWIQELGGWLVLALLIKPLITLSVVVIGNLSIPEWRGWMQDWSLWLALPFYLFIDDFLQYWYHRLAHERPFLWKLHRAHHQAEEMGFFVSYRNAALYYLIMPNIWWIGLILFLGGGQAVALGLILKQLVIIGSHSTIKWDKPLYQSRLFRPLVLILERIIITPAFHHAHHGRSKLDRISDPNGNFGNMFSLWDQFFGTARYTHQFPAEYGLQSPTSDSWQSAYLYPLISSDDPASELARSFTKEPTITDQPGFIEVKKGKSYLWCSCGLSKKQPFCDGSHHGTNFKPVLFEAQADARY
ncbi:MAG: sterol desaturase family protein, partial [Bacteroidota bacterium]